jgi:hypothetical protein
MRTTIAIVTTLALLALVTPAASAGSCTEPGDPLFGVARVDGKRVLARIEPRTLRPRAAGRVPLPRHATGWSWAFSPDCKTVALAGRPHGRIQLVDVERARRAGTVSVGGWASAGTIAWPVADRLSALAGPYPRPRVVTVSVPDGRVVADLRVGGRPVASEGTALGLVVVASPLRDRIGSATLVLARPDGGALRVPLAGIRAGYEAPRRNPLLGRQLTPGLAVDEAGGRAFVVAANEPVVAEVSLLSGAVAYHDVGGAGAASAPSASKGLAYGAFRTARWVAPGTIAVSGEETRMRRNWRRAVRRGGLPATIEPYGLQLIDVSDWTVSTLHRSLRWFAQTGDTFVGADVLPVTQDRSRATGLVAYGLDGRRRFERFAGEEDVGLWGAAWPYAYVSSWRPRRTYVVDLRTGRTANVLPRFRLPVIFSDAAV